MTDKYSLAIERKEKLITESEVKIFEYKEKIKQLKNEIRVLKAKRDDALGKQLLALCKNGDVDFDNETLSELFAKAGITIPKDEKEKPLQEIADSLPEDAESPVQSLTLEMSQ